MPLLKLHTSCHIDDAKRTELAKSLSTITAETIGKPETYVMVTIAEGTICMSGQVGHGAFVDVRSIGGLSPTVNNQISKRVCDLLTTELEIPGNRIYLNFSEIERFNWGWDSKTF